jgi:hypothetical protein
VESWDISQPCLSYAVLAAVVMGMALIEQAAPLRLWKPPAGDSEIPFLTQNTTELAAPSQRVPLFFCFLKLPKSVYGGGDHVNLNYRKAG